MSESRPDSLEQIRHSAAHVMAAAVCHLYADVRLDIGPATEDGFYYDFDLPHRLGPEDFPRIEEEMARIASERHPFVREEVSREEAEQRLRDQGQLYKLERLAEIPPSESISFYRSGTFSDLCRGPHVADTGQIGAFKLLSVAGSYFHGIETNPMLQRVYGTTYLQKEDLDRYLAQVEEAKQRDHRKLGKELDLFSVEESVGPGLIHWHPKGARVRCAIEDFWRRAHFRNGYDLLYTPHIGRAELWENSGHLGFYRESMYAPMIIDENEYFIKPMNCPFHIQVYRSRKRSYRELPLRWAELGTVYRYEKAGVLHGLLRVRGFTQDDAHIMCTPDQVESEVRTVIRFARAMWKAFGFEDIRAYLATRPEKSVGDDAQWDQASRSLEATLRAEEIPYERDPGGGAFYGPKIDLKVRDAIGREWQMSTVQFDFNLPERFDMSFVGEDGKPHRPYMIHRALFGSIERFFGILLEHYAGAFPIWMAPEQARVLPLSEKVMDAARAVRASLFQAGLRTGLDERSEKIGAKIRQAQVEKIPYMLIVGPREAAAGQAALRSRVDGDLGPMPIADIIERLVSEAAQGEAPPLIPEYT